MWEELLKVQITNNKQGIKTSQRKLPEPDDDNCKDTLKKWLANANQLISKYELDYMTNENQDNLEIITDEEACKIIQIYNDTVKNEPSGKSRHINIANTDAYDLNMFVSTPGIYHFNSIPYFHRKITVVKNWVTVYTCVISMHKVDWHHLLEDYEEVIAWQEKDMLKFGREFLDFTK
tara:strand:+ start:5472 stop:6002 length:531 start_codon:yes stop_codon:yes gene_type:complete